MNFNEIKEQIEKLPQFKRALCIIIVDFLSTNNFDYIYEISGALMAYGFDESGTSFDDVSYWIFTSVFFKEYTFNPPYKAQ